jgi:hypothetical protein
MPKSKIDKLPAKYPLGEFVLGYADITLRGYWVIYQVMSEKNSEARLIEFSCFGNVEDATKTLVKLREANYRRERV